MREFHFQTNKSAANSSDLTTAQKKEENFSRRKRKEIPFCTHSALIAQRNLVLYFCLRLRFIGIDKARRRKEFKFRKKKNSQ
jgi:hypothetical protein